MTAFPESSSAETPSVPGNNTTITACTDGPLLVRGDFELLRDDGTPIENKRSTVALCRCGGPASRRSATAPTRRSGRERRNRCQYSEQARPVNRDDPETKKRLDAGTMRCSVQPFQSEVRLGSNSDGANVLSWGPFWPCPISNSTFWPSSRDL